MPYYVATLHKKHDILVYSEDGETYYHHADIKTYSDLGINPRYEYSVMDLKDIQPASRKDFARFRVHPPSNYF